MPTPLTGVQESHSLIVMQNVSHLLRSRRFLPLFVTQFLGAFNDSLFKQVVVLFVVYQVYSDPTREAQFNAIAQALFILPFFLLSAMAGQLADIRDKARIIRLVKTAEVGIMLVGGAGLYLGSIPIMLAALFAMGVHSTFFGPIKYAILPQHLHKDEVLGGTGLVEAGTYIAILGGTVLAGLLVLDVRNAAFAVITIALLGLYSGYKVPHAPPKSVEAPPDWHIVRASIRLVNATMHVPRLFLSILSISFFWSIGAVLIFAFPQLVKNILGADELVASLFVACFSVGVAIGSIAINRLLKSEVSARFSPVSVLGMGGFVLMLHLISANWDHDFAGELLTLGEFLDHPGATLMVISLLGIAICGGMFVVPLYAFLTTTVDPGENARVVAANNVVNAGAMVGGLLIAFLLASLGASPNDQLLFIACMCIFAAWLANKLHRACDGVDCSPK